MSPYVFRYLYSFFLTVTNVRSSNAQYKKYMNNVATWKRSSGTSCGDLAGWIIILPRLTVTFLMFMVIKTVTRHSKCGKYFALAKSFRTEFSPKLSLKQKIVILYLWVIVLQGIHPCPLIYYSFILTLSSDWYSSIPLKGL